jgi:hypothetical protein
MSFMSSTQRGNALAETVVVLLAVAPFIAGMVLLGKQLDVKHKSFDALRYTVWERTVWSERGANAKSEADLTTEALDRAFGHPHAGLSSAQSLRTEGVSQNPLWRYHRRALLVGDQGSAMSSRDDATPVEVGHVLSPALAYGAGPLSTAAGALQMDDLGLNRRGFAGATIETNVRPLLSSLAHGDASNAEQTPLLQRATGAVLSDTWSPRDEQELGRRVGGTTSNELIETLELPGRPLSMQALSKGGPLYGEGQYGWDPDLRPRSNALPTAYVIEREDE